MISSMQHVVSIPSVDEYFDRLKMFCEVGRYFEKQYVYLRAGDIDRLGSFLTKYPKTVFVRCADRTNTISRAASLWRFLGDLEERPTVIQDVLAPDMALLSKAMNWRGLPVTKFASFSSPSTKFYHMKAWENLQPEVSPVGRKFYYKLYRKRALIDRLASKVCHGIIANSSEINESFLGYYNFPESRMRVIPTAIDIDSYQKKDIKKHSLNLPQKGIMLLSVGSVQPSKDTGLLINAVDYFRRNYYKDIYLVVCGDFRAGSKQSFQLLVNKLQIQENVIFLDWLSSEQLALYYSVCDCFVHASRWEGSPRVVKEALAFGSKVVAADIPGNRIIDPDESFIHYFRPSDIEEFCVAVIRCLNSRGNPQAQRKYLRDNFSPKNIAQQYINFYREILQSQV